MDAELQKLVESGKLTARAAEQLDKLKPVTFCLHKSWGFGRVSEWNMLLNQIIIDFVGKKAHPMQLQYAAENLTAIPPEHFLARKASDLATIKKLAREDPAAVMRNVLESAGGNATLPQIAQWLIGDVFSETEWKRWWESAKKVLKKDGHFFIPTKRVRRSSFALRRSRRPMNYSRLLVGRAGRRNRALPSTRSSGWPMNLRNRTNSCSRLSLPLKTQLPAIKSCIRSFRLNYCSAVMI